MLSAGGANLPRSDHAQRPPHANLRHLDDWEEKPEDQQKEASL